MTDRGLCSLALWLYYVGLTALLWVSGFMLLVAASAMLRGAFLAGAFVLAIGFVVTWEPWRAVLSLRRELFSS